MRITTSTGFYLAILGCSALGCDAGKNPIGSLDTGTGTETGDPGVGGSCTEPGVYMEFEVLGLEPGIHDLELVCASAVSPEPDGWMISLTGCSDAHPDLDIRLIGDWSEPLVDGEQAIELRYVELPLSLTIDEVSYDHGIGRWLVLRNPGGQFPIPLVAVDAPATYPSAYAELDFDFDFAPLVFDVIEADCELPDHPACGQRLPAALVVNVDDQPFAVAEGAESWAVGVGSDYYHVMVDRMREFVDDCFEFPNEYRFGIVAYPNS